ncbi:MAG: AAA family ATPase, partial [Bacteroidia bacterium]
NIYHPDGTLKNSFVSTYEYDSEGKKITPQHNPQPYIHYPDPSMLYEEGAETDAQGNWIKKITNQTEGPRKYFIRELVYEGEDKTLEHPLSKIENKEQAEREPDYEKYKLEKEDAKWLAEWPSFTPDNFPFARYYTLRFHEAPSITFFQGPAIEAMVLLKRLKEDLHADVVHTYSNVWNGNQPRLQRYTISFPHNWGYLLHCHNISSHNADEYSIPRDFIDKYSEQIYTSQFSLLHPSDVNSARDYNFEERISSIIDECSLRKKPEKPVINIIEVKNGNYTTKEYAVHDNFIIKDLDVNYGHGFEKFHNDLMQRFNSSTKGLVLFHGIPGTGKTFYIRHLLRKMVANRKDVIYIPPNMVDHLVDPAFMTFLSNELKSWSEEGHTCVLLIEDAEPLLAKRQEGIRIQGVTNLLNMTDGLLNDMLNIQIICTFNVDLQKLDSALLRPGRLIARKEFKALSVLDANLLAQRLGIKHHFKKPATLGEIYSMQKNQNTLVHDVEQDKGASKNIDDL